MKNAMKPREQQTKLNIAMPQEIYDADFDKVLNNPEYCAIVGDKDIASLHKDKARVQIRMKSNKIKNEGDKAFYHERLEEAVEKYNEALEVDQENEYALANICAIHLKKLEYE